MGSGSSAARPQSTRPTSKFYTSPPSNNTNPQYGWSSPVIQGDNSNKHEPYMGNQLQPVNKATTYPHQQQQQPPQPDSPNKKKPYPVQEPLASTEQNLQQADEGYQWSYDRDRVYMMVLSADEFLGRMYETDERIHVLSQASEKDLHKKTIQDLFGLRGHLQDELLRIEQMLAKDDPKLKCLNFLEGNFKHVVSKLKELRQKEQLVSAKVVQDELPPSRSKESVTQAGGPHGTSTGTQSTEAGTSQAKQTVLTEEDLKQKHDEEEKELAENYTHRIVTKPGVSREEVDNLLQDHALSMQALRKRQEDERKRNTQKLKDKLRDRSHKNDSEDSEDSPSSTPTDVRRKDPFLQSDEEGTEDSDDEGAGTEVLRDTMWNKMTLSSKRMTAENLKDMVESFTQEDQKSKHLTRRSTKSNLPVITEAQTPRNDDVDVNSNKATLSASTGIDSGTSTVSMVTGIQGSGTGVGTDDNDNEQVQSLLKEDEDFVRNFLQRNLDGMSDEDYTKFMEDYLKDRDRIRKLKDYEKRQLQEKLKKKLWDRNHRPGSAASNASDYSDDFEPDKYGNKTSKTSSDEEQTRVSNEEIDGEENKELKKLKEEFLATLSRKKREGISESELQKLLEEYRRKQLQIIKDKESARNKHQDKMNAKLAERLRQKEDIEKTLESSEDDDSAFFERLQRMQANGELSKEQFSEMLKTYMDRKKQNNRKRRLASRDSENDKKAASEIVNKYNKDNQELHDIRKAEREKMNAKLQKRLRSKKIKEQNQCYGDTSYNDSLLIQSIKDDSHGADADYEF